MRILEIVPTLSSGGGERFTVDLCNVLSSRHEVILLTLFPIKGNWAFLLNDVNPRIKIISLNKKFGFDFHVLVRVFHLIRKFNPDIVHSHLQGIVYTFFPSLIIKSTLFFHTIHSEAKREADTGIVARLTRRFAFKHKLITPITISNETLISFESYYGYSCPMIVNGRNVDSNISISDSTLKEFEQYRRSTRTRIIINLARLHRVKRQVMLAKVAKRLNMEGYDLSVLIIGQNNDEVILDEIEKIGCPHLYVLGQKPNPLEYLQLSDAFVLCSSQEGMPISLIEALGVGCIPVCTPVGGIKDVVKNGENGILAEDISEEAFYNALKLYLSLDEEKIESMKVAALESYKPFTMVECATKYEILFKERKGCNRRMN